MIPVHESDLVYQNIANVVWFHPLKMIIVSLFFIIYFFFFIKKIIYSIYLFIYLFNLFIY